MHKENVKASVSGTLFRFDVIGPYGIRSFERAGGSAVDPVDGEDICYSRHVLTVTLPLISPMSASTGTPNRNLGNWIHEVKFDGWRARVYLDGGLKVRTRAGRQVSDSLPELAGLVDALEGRSAILDGELIACVDGVPDVYWLGPRMSHTGRMARSASTQTSVTYVAFDLLHLDGEDLTGRPLLERTQLLVTWPRRDPPGQRTAGMRAMATLCSTSVLPWAMETHQGSGTAW